MRSQTFKAYPVALWGMNVKLRLAAPQKWVAAFPNKSQVSVKQAIAADAALHSLRGAIGGEGGKAIVDFKGSAMLQVETHHLSEDLKEKVYGALKPAKTR